MEQLYKKTILRHYQNPSNKDKIAKPDEIFSGANPFCGDKIEIRIKLDGRKKIKEVSWSGDGCVISQASASIFSELIKGKTLSQARRMTSGDLLEELAIELSPSRRKCALLPLFTIKEITEDEN